MNSAMPPPLAPEPDREINRFLAADQEQLMGLSSLMRRSEELADRVCGQQPTSSASSESNKSVPNGLLGALGPMHNDRDAMIDRISGALSRIEQVL